MDNFERQRSIEEYQIPVSKKGGRRRRFRFGFFVLLLVCILTVIAGVLLYKTGFTFDQITTGSTDNILPLAGDLNTPLPDPDRLNVLILGQRGEDDPNGGLLTDSIMLLSLKKSTNQVSLISVPRDLYVTMPGENYKEKINFAYALGYEKKGVIGGMFLSKVAVSLATGQYIDHVILINHAAFKEIVDILGGVDIHLDKPFIESEQWVNGGDAGSSWAFSIRTETRTEIATTSRIQDIATSTATTSSVAIKTQKWVFEIPAGTSHLDGNTALYYVRARYTSSDFDRVARQQRVLLAVKDKALSLGFLGNPVKIYQALDSLGRNIRTDFSLDEIKNLMPTVQNTDTKNIIHKVFDTTPEGLLYAAKAENGAYILLPIGDNFDKIQEACRNIFNY